MDQNNNNELQNSQWKPLYQITAISALISVAVIFISIAAFFIWPIFPDDIFAVIQSNRFAGIMSLDFLYFAGCFLSIPIFLSLYITLKNTNQSYAVLALALGLIGFMALIPSRPIAEMLNLSDQYATATTEAQKAEIMVASRAILALFHGTAYNVHYVLGTLSLLISSFVMLRSPIFSKATAYVGIFTNLAVFSYYVPGVGVYLSIISVLGYVVWWIQIAKKLFQLAREA